MLILKNEDDPLIQKVIQFFEFFRMAYLSALSDPKNYSDKWEKAIDKIREQWDDIDDFSKAIKNIVSEEDVFSKEVKEVESHKARDIYESIRKLRYSSKLVKDPFSNAFGEDVLDKIMENESLFAQFIHWAIRTHSKSLSDKAWSSNDLDADSLTEGYDGLNLAEDSVVDFIVEHYGDGKDTQRVASKYKHARKLLEKIFVAQHGEGVWNKTLSLEKAEKKANIHFLIPNKPMYRIFDLDDLKELKGFTGDYVVQEKYDGMRIQIHKIDNKIKIFSFNGNDITDKCPVQVKIMKEKYFGDCILDGELMLFDGDTPLHRAEVVAHIFKNKQSDTILRAHMFDIMRHEEEDLHDSPLSERLQILFNNYSTHSDEMLAFPSKKDTRYADSIEEVGEYAKEIMKIPTSEGVVIKDITSTYFIGTKKNPKWVKWKKFVDLDLIVLDKKTTESNMFTYTLGAGPVIEEDYSTETINDIEYLNVGKALNTKIDVKIGDIIRVKVDEVKKNENGYKLYSAKVIEIPEVDTPDKLITLDLLSQDTKQSLNYDIKALEKGYSITDNIHGTAIIKSDFDGFVFYGFEENNLMAKNALLDLDIWKEEMKEVIKTQKSLLRLSIRNHLAEEKMSFESVEEFVSQKHKTAYNNLFNNESEKLLEWLKTLDDIVLIDDKFQSNPETIEKKYETPEEYRHGDFKLYYNDTETLSLMFKLKDVTLGWEIKITSEDDIFSLFGKSDKFPAQIQNNFRKGKLVDSGKVELGVQRHGYHEYLLDGNKFNTKFHVRVIPIKGEEVWLVWTGLETEPVESESDDGIWNINKDDFAKLTYERLE